jgi:UDP-N-acetylglucosamine 2-epimerase
MGRLICVAGTRPEVIKMAPVISALTAAGHDAPLLVTAQHRQLGDPDHYEAMARPRFPYGDGAAAARIQCIISRALDARRNP